MGPGACLVRERDELRVCQLCQDPLGASADRRNPNTQRHLERNVALARVEKTVKAGRMCSLWVSGVPSINPILSPLNVTTIFTWA